MTSQGMNGQQNLQDVFKNANNVVVKLNDDLDQILKEMDLADKSFEEIHASALDVMQLDFDALRLWNSI